MNAKLNGTEWAVQGHLVRLNEEGDIETKNLPPEYIAAPELLAALKGLEAAAGVGHVTISVVLAARAAIAKAESKS